LKPHYSHLSEKTYTFAIHNQLIYNIFYYFKVVRFQSKIGVKAGEPIALVGFGTFEVKARAERTGTKTGQAITIAAANIPAFKAGKT
jgi:hypothetical protein